MEKIVEYKLLSAETSRRITEMVNEHIQKGWQPYGSPSTTMSEKNFRFNQAIVKYQQK